MDVVCKIEGCGSIASRRRLALCEKHYMRIRRNGHPGRKRTANPLGFVDASGYLVVKSGEEFVRKHVCEAERALGKKLPPKSNVHHVDGNKTNNEHNNLVICQDMAYHKLLHVRANALRECGNVDHRRCYWCHEYDETSNMTKGASDNVWYHNKCAAAKQRERYKAHRKEHE